VFLLSINFVFSQKENDPKHEYHYKTVAEKESDIYSLKITDAHSQQTFTQFRIHLKNKSSNYLILRVNEINFIYDFGELHPKTKEFLINPGETFNKIIKASDASQNLHVKSLKIKISGIKVSGKTLRDTFIINYLRENPGYEKEIAVLKGCYGFKRAPPHG